MNLPVEPGIRLRGSRIATGLLRLAGWRVHFDGLPAAQGVLIVYPHTSAWDFIVGLLAKWAIGIEVTFWGKDTLFAVPVFGRWMRWLGGVPVDRKAARGIVGQMAEALVAARSAGRFMWLALSPEGTRRLTAGWRSGFYFTALQAKVPLGLVGLDYKRREVTIKRFIALTGETGADLAEIAQQLQQPVGRHPALASPIRFMP
jgi:1-acyl-sn-glycerol-3-phosphate acyltransferase